MKSLTGVLQETNIFLSRLIKIKSTVQSIHVGQMEKNWVCIYNLGV